MPALIEWVSKKIVVVVLSWREENWSKNPNRRRAVLFRPAAATVWHGRLVGGGSLTWAVAGCRRRGGSGWAASWAGQRRRWARWRSSRSGHMMTKTGQADHDLHPQPRWGEDLTQFWWFGGDAHWYAAHWNDLATRKWRLEVSIFEWRL
jgi:hypothetical protein